MTEKMNENNEEELLKEEEQQTQDTEKAPETEAQAEDKEETPKESTVEEQLEKAREEISELNDSLLRKMAEFDNYRKRTLKEKTELILNGGKKTITAILPVLDDMERAMKNMQTATDVAAVLEGVELIYKKFISILEHQGVKAIDTKDADFNVDLHEAIAQLPAPNSEMKGKIIDCTLTGYTMNEKVIRHAQVVVGV
ncbi:MAG: nucleotide exchange factor GrpE [Bacteroidaceae bacterium]|nr:nucleotide exchange factor GrpE [Bacteroidaceae bacterium]